MIIGNWVLRVIMKYYVLCIFFSIYMYIVDPLKAQWLVRSLFSIIKDFISTTRREAHIPYSELDLGTRP